MMNKKQLFMISFGTSLELFDFVLYASFIETISSTFFPPDNKLSSLLMALGGFGIGFIMRPFGAYIFGYFGDKFGRKKMILTSMLLMGLPTLILSFLPGYETIGMIAPLVIVVSRLLQGIAFGGEYNGVYIFALEHSLFHQGKISGMITSTSVIGLVMATLCALLTQRPEMPDWAWRIPFLGGGMICFFGYIMRSRLQESIEFSTLLSKTHDSFFKIIKDLKLSCVLTLSLGTLMGGFFYTHYGFLPLYLSRYGHVSSLTALEINLVGLAFIILCSPLFGKLYDMFPADVYFRKLTYLFFFLLIPIFWLISSSHLSLILIGEAAFGLCVAAIMTAGHSFMQKLFPVHARYRSIAFFYNLGSCLCGGSASFIYIEAIEIHHESLLFPAYFLMFLTSIFYVLLQFRKRAFFHFKKIKEPSSSPHFSETASLRMKKINNDRA